MLRARIEVYRGARKVRFPLKPLYRTDRNRDTHIALCRTVGYQKQQNLPSTQRSWRTATPWIGAATLCTCIWGRTQANAMNYDTTQITAMCTDKQRETRVQRKLPAHVMARCRHDGANDWQMSNACAVCAQGVNAARCNYEWEQRVRVL